MSKAAKAGGVFRTVVVLGAIVVGFGVAAWKLGKLPQLDGVLAEEGEDPDSTSPDGEPSVDREGASADSPGDPTGQAGTDQTGTDQTGTDPAEPGSDSEPNPSAPASTDNSLATRFEAPCLRTEGAPELSNVVPFGPHLEVAMSCGRAAYAIRITDNGDSVSAVVIGRLYLDSNRRTATHLSYRPGLFDVTGDGIRDWLVPYELRSPNGGSRGGRVAVARGTDDPAVHFARPRIMNRRPAQRVASAGPHQFLLADRGRPWAGTHGGLTFVDARRGLRQSRRIETLSVGSTQRLALVDLDLDGDLDVAIAVKPTPLGGPGGVLIYPRTGTNTLGDPLRQDGGDGELVVGDTTGDGHDDLVVQSRTGATIVAARARQPDQIGLSTAESISFAGTPFGVRDVDGDGEGEVLTHDGGHIRAVGAPEWGAHLANRVVQAALGRFESGREALVVLVSYRDEFHMVLFVNDSGAGLAAPGSAATAVATSPTRSTHSFL